MLLYVNMYEELNLVLSCGFFSACVFFAWLTDMIWKISGRKTDSLISMA